MPDLKRTIRALEVCTSGVQSDLDCTDCPYHDDCESHPMCPMMEMLKDALALLKEQEPRVLSPEEVEALPYGYVLIETDKKDSLHWVEALLFCKNTNFSFDFITLEGRARLLGSTYNMEWRCWTSRPSDEQREATPWE